MKKHIEDVDKLLADYAAIPQSNNLTELVYWLAKAVLFLLVRYIDGE